MSATPGTGGYDQRTALLVVDVQNDFAHPDGNLSVSGGDEAITAMNREIEAARAAGSPVIYTQDWHPERTPHFETDGGTWPVHCVKGTWGAALHDDLDVVGEERIYKGADGGDGYSAFSVRDPESGEEGATELETILRDRGVERLVVVGLAQDVCVKDSVLDAVRRGFDVEVVTDATRPVELEPGDGERALQTMKEAGAQLR